MKKFLAVILTLVFAVTAIPAFAEYESIDCTEAYTADVVPPNVVLEQRDDDGNITTEAETYENGIVYTRKVPEAYHSASTNAFEKTSNHTYGIKSDVNACGLTTQQQVLHLQMCSIRFPEKTGILQTQALILSPHL